MSLPAVFQGRFTLYRLERGGKFAGAVIPYPAGDLRHAGMGLLPEQEGRPLRWTSMQAITNFYGCYAYMVQPNQRNGIYGHGKERYDAIMEVLAMRDPDGDIPADTAWKALQAAAQDPSPNDVTSNTQWSLVYDDTDLTAQIVIRRKWGDVIHYDLNTNEIDG